MARIDYQLLLDNALKSVVKDALVFAQINGLGDGSHFFITFKTRDAGVVLPDFLRMRYPDIMTIVLQYSYTNLHVSDKEFGVQLTFDGRPFFIRVPFSALVEFKDPSVVFFYGIHLKIQRVYHQVQNFYFHPMVIPYHYRQIRVGFCDETLK